MSGQRKEVQILLFLVLLSTFAVGQENSHRPVEIFWSEDFKYPGIVVGDQRWVVSVFPPDADEKEFSSPEVVSGDSHIKARVLHISRVHQLCLLEPEERLSGLEPFTIVNRISPEPGVILRSVGMKQECRSHVAGRDFEYHGESLPCPLLRIRLEPVSGEKLCRPGTPLVNEKGELEALLGFSKMNGERESHAVPAHLIHKMVYEIAHHEKTGPVYLGVLLDQYTTTPEVVDVSKDSPAARAGVEKGDVILSINGITIHDFPEVLEVVHGLPAGESAEVKVMRDVEHLALKLTPEFLPEEMQP